MSGSYEQIRADMDALAHYDGRFPASEGERAILHGVKARIPHEAEPVVEGFVSPKYPDLMVGIHVSVLFVGGLVGFWYPIWGGVLTAVATLALLAETTGRFSLAPWVMTKVAAYNLVLRTQVSAPQATIVLTTPLDVPKYRKWETRWIRWTRRPLQWVFGASMVLLGLMVLRALGEPLGPRTRDLHLVAVAILATTVLVGLIAYRRETEGRDSGSGPALLLEIQRRLQATPLPEGVEVWFAYLACNGSYQGGMRHFLNLHSETVTSPTLFISVQNPGGEPLVAVNAEGPIVPQVHRPTGPALVERLQWAGVNIPQQRSWRVSDAREAQRRGFRALALSGGRTRGSAESTGRAADVVEMLMRWYAHDVGHVADDRNALQALANSIGLKRKRSKQKTEA